jgi:sugar phosphate isomerase/epimerase
MADSIPLGVQSYCFRGFPDGAAVAAKVKEIGLSRIELCVRHADFSAPAAFPAVLEVYRSRGVSVISIGVNTITGDEAKDRNLFEFCKAAGARHMSVDFAPDNLQARLRSAEKLSEQYGVLCGIHVHGGRHWLGSSQALRWVFSQCSKRIGLCLDTAWAMDAGEDPLKMVGEFADRLHLLHLKDFVFDPARKPEDMVVGTGNLDLPALQAALRKAGFRGLAVLEYEGDVNDPVPALKECVKKSLAGMADLKA